jgi:DNA-binding CsgD family transcriptional regulator
VTTGRPGRADRSAATGTPVSSLAGQPQVDALLTALATRPHAPLAAIVVGPGGSGKSALVAALLRSARRHGVPARRVRSGDPVPFPSEEEVLLLVDDAHLLDESTLADLTDVADDPQARVVITARPAPRPRALATLRLALGRTTTPITLAPLNAAGVTERLTASLGPPGGPDLAEALFRLSGGSPAVVDRLVTLLREAGPRALSAVVAGTSDVPVGVLDLLRHEIDGLDDPTRRALLALAVGAPRVPAALADVLDVDRTTLDDLLDRARATGLLLPDVEPSVEPAVEPDAVAERVPPLVGRSLIRLAGADVRLALERRIAERALARGAPVLRPARRLLGAGLRGDELARVFTAAGDEALGTAPHLAGELYADAVAAGAAPEAVVLRRAEAAALAGDLDTALRLADPVSATGDEGDRARATAVVAAVMARRGMGARAAQMLADVPDLRAVAVPWLVAHGELGRAAGLPTAAPGRSVTAGAAVRCAADGVLSSLGSGPGAASAALSELTRAASLLEPLDTVAVLPDSPAALAALVALHTGEIDVAESILERACAAGAGGPALLPRHHLLRAWVAMVRGDVRGLRAHVATASAAGPFEPRDELVAAALEAGVARRTGDAVALRAGWRRAREALVRHPVDLFVLLPLGELAVAAARLREQASVRPAVAAAEALLAGLGNPPVWCATTHWYRLAAAVTAEEVPAAEEALTGLRAVAHSSPLAALLEPAAREWLSALSGRVDATAVEEAAWALHRLGWTWDGVRLAGEAAIRTHDRRAMEALFACARSLSDAGRAITGAHGPDHPGVPTSGSAGVAGEIMLTDREREVARLVLDGLTYKQAGARLFISAKTVEHHVARIRQRLRSGSRKELFDQLRELVEPPA